MAGNEVFHARTTSQYNAHLPRSVQAQAARLILQANLAFGESNSNGLSYVQRLKARFECREYLDQALALEPENAAALGLLGQLEKAHVLLGSDPKTFHPIKCTGV
ncbi:MULTISPECIES: hypothetical protein [Marinobacter]|jgi:hypothetical protein|uniref:Uncharacterized protein n=1 Tax=Marinobacter shengliensis TaxID=1389223 RepID=A0ABV4W7L7_9GAMM